MLSPAAYECRAQQQCEGCGGGSGLARVIEWGWGALAVSEQTLRAMAARLQAKSELKSKKQHRAASHSVQSFVGCPPQCSLLVLLLYCFLCHCDSGALLSATLSEQTRTVALSPHLEIRCSQPSFKAFAAALFSGSPSHWASIVWLGSIIRIPELVAIQWRYKHSL